MKDYRYHSSNQVRKRSSGNLILYVMLFLFLPMAGMNAFGQKEMLREIFTEAESHFLFGEYTLANPLYLMLDDNLDNNANIKYKIGICYLNIPHEKEKAIPYLEEAVKNVSYDAHEELFSEPRAPLDALFYLGNAYRINNQLDKALATYEEFRKQLSSKKKMENEDFIDQQIVACRNALKMMEEPISFSKENLGEKINLTSMNIRPVISGDGNSLVFTAKLGEDNVVYYTKKEYGEWLPPMDITDQIGSDRDCSPTDLNYDGTLMLLYKVDNFDGSIYQSTLNGDQWSKIQKLNKNINTKFYESHASLNKEGTLLYFASNRTGSIGGLDLYVSEKNGRGDWGEPRNLGPSVNTKYNEDCPYITENDSFLYFSSEGHLNMGGYDIFRSRKNGNEFGKPENLGYPLNTTDDDLYFHPFKNGASGYFSIVSGYKQMDIYRINFSGSAAKRVYEIKGIVTLPDTAASWLKNVRFALLSKPAMDTVDIGKPNAISRWYFTTATYGNYILKFYGPGILPREDTIEISEDLPEGAIIHDVTLGIDTALTVRAGIFYIIRYSSWLF